MNKFIEKIKSFTLQEKISLILILIFMIIGYYFAINMNIKIASGLTLFGNANSFKDGVIESTNPSYSDYLITILIYVLSTILLAYLIFVLFIKKQEKKVVIKKEIVNGKTVILEDSFEEEKEENK